MVSTAAVDVHACHTVDGTSVLKSDPSIRCGVGVHRAMVVVSWIGTAAWVAGIPVFSVYVVFLYKNRLGVPAVRRALGFLIKCVAFRAATVRRARRGDVFCVSLLWVTFPRQWLPLPAVGNFHQSQGCAHHHCQVRLGVGQHVPATRHLPVAPPHRLMATGARACSPADDLVPADSRAPSRAACLAPTQ